SRTREMTYIDIIERVVADKAEGLRSAANEIWSFAEIRYEEYKSAALLADLLEAEGFAVERRAG
ncbi:amidohydrolase, partial [Rhizobium ruizarguesonis]